MSVFYSVSYSVSTHSRTEAAASCGCLGYFKKEFQHTAARRRLLFKLFETKRLGCFNTQPHGGGCQCKAYHAHDKGSFNTQPHGGGCVIYPFFAKGYSVSTHSRTEAAACDI